MELRVEHPLRDLRNKADEATGDTNGKLGHEKA